MNKIKYVPFTLCSVLLLTLVNITKVQANIPVPILRESNITIKSDNELIYTLKSGDTLQHVLKKLKIKDNLSNQIIAQTNNLTKPSEFRPGMQIHAKFKKNNQQLQNLSIILSQITEIKFSVNASDKIESAIIEKKTTKEIVKAKGTIESTLFTTATQAGVSSRILGEMIRLLSYDVDFQRDIRKGNSFEVMYEQEVIEGNIPVGQGAVIYVSLALNNKELQFYRHATPDGKINYYNKNGESIRKSLLKTPVDGARITSGFGKRRHPILGYTKMHKGIDFGAPSGTKIYAAGNGVIKYVGKKGGYGNYIRISHSNGYDTAYAHLRRFAKGIRKGKYIKQGQVIGYVGTTGRSTGPHLHYEVLKHNKQINPLSIKTFPGKKLKSVEAGIFHYHKRQIDQLLNILPNGNKYAKTKTSN